MSHVVHLDISEGGLADGCQRCEEIAQHPLEHLDDPNLSELWLRMVRFQYVGDEGSRPRTMNEAVAMERLEFAAKVLRKAGCSKRALLRMFEPGVEMCALSEDERVEIESHYDGLPIDIARSLVAAVQDA